MEESQEEEKHGQLAMFQTEGLNINNPQRFPDHPERRPR
jgi:hypothetical protein